MRTQQTIDQDAPSILYEDWKAAIQIAQDIDELVKLMRAYMGGWRHEDLELLPCDLASIAIPSPEAIVARAVIASQLELKFRGVEREHNVLKQLSLTFAAAANRLRYLQSSSQYLTNSTCFQSRSQ